MRRNRCLRILKVFPIGILAVARVRIRDDEHLWNWLMPAMFGLQTVTFWQALGLLVLSKILFGGFTSARRRTAGGMEARNGGALGADDS